MRGAYHFNRTTTTAKQQGEHFIRNMELLSGDSFGKDCTMISGFGL